MLTPLILVSTAVLGLDLLLYRDTTTSIYTTAGMQVRTGQEITDFGFDTVGRHALHVIRRRMEEINVVTGGN